MRRLLVPLLGALFLVSLLPTPVQALPAVPYCAGSVSPVAPSAGAPATIMPEACEQATSRVFPESIFLPEYAAAGNTGYATDFVSFFEAQAGLEYLNATYPDWIEIHTVAESYGWPATPGGELVHSPVYVVEVTNEQSPVPLDQRLELLFMLSIHGVEKGGREGGLRVIEDFVKNIGVAAETVQNGAGMPTPLGKPTGGKVTTYRDYLDFTRMFFLFPNPDGWTHDELPYVASGGVCGGNGALMCRANGNGTDLNRQTPTIGWQLINEGAGRLPVNEPEAVGYLNWLVEGHEWNYAIDIHGMLNHQNFLAIMMPAGSASSQEMLRSTRLAETLKERVNLDPHFAQWTTLLAVSAQVGDAECEQGPPAPCSIPLPVLGPTRIRDVGSEEFADWSTVWDAIGYTDSGTSGDFFAQQNGLNAPGYDIEMAYNHLVADSAYPGIGAFWNDYHIHSVRHIVKSFLDAAALDVKVSLETNGHRTAYVKPTFVATSLDDESFTPGGWADANPNDDHFQYSAEAPIMATPGKYWTDLQPFVRDGEAPGVLTALDASRVSGSALDGYDTLVIPGSAIRDLEAEE
ncbi:MAG TPA: hypothetical protein VI796_03420, partial [Candidatus Thermoplasmatota archaeon]|nr:hypothetical protein [Candidatus Thermoplasmatota archaeon]